MGYYINTPSDDTNIFPAHQAHIHLPKLMFILCIQRHQQTNRLECILCGFLYGIFTVLDFKQGNCIYIILNSVLFTQGQII